MFLQVVHNPGVAVAHIETMTMEAFTLDEQVFFLMLVIIGYTIGSTINTLRRRVCLDKSINV